MFTFTIHNGDIVKVEGVPDLVFQTEDYDKFLENKDVFAEQFPEKIFGCVASTDATYALNEENRVESGDIGDVRMVYYGICSKE